MGRGNFEGGMGVPFQFSAGDIRKHIYLRTRKPRRIVTFIFCAIQIHLLTSLLTYLTLQSTETLRSSVQNGWTDQDAASLGAHSRHLANTIQPSVCGDDAALCQITLTTCYNFRKGGHAPSKMQISYFTHRTCLLNMTLQISQLVFFSQNFSKWSWHRQKIRRHINTRP